MLLLTTLSGAGWQLRWRGPGAGHHFTVGPMEGSARYRPRLTNILLFTTRLCLEKRRPTSGTSPLQTKPKAASDKLMIEAFMTETGTTVRSEVRLFSSKDPQHHEGQDACGLMVIAVALDTEASSSENYRDLLTSRASRL
jgi:hypothetical protein